MKLAEQIDMMKLLEKSQHKEARLWARNGRREAAWTCEQYAITCGEVLKSLRRLKRLEGRQSTLSLNGVKK